MQLEFLDLLAACRRSRIKHRVLRALVTASPALPGELADAADTSIDRVFAVLHGDGERFRHDTSLVALGAAQPVQTPRGLAYAITDVGRAASGLIAHRLRRRT